MNIYIISVAETVDEKDHPVQTKVFQMKSKCRHIYFYICLYICEYTQTLGSRFCF